MCGRFFSAGAEEGGSSGGGDSCDNDDDGDDDDDDNGLCFWFLYLFVCLCISTDARSVLFGLTSSFWLLIDEVRGRR